MWLINTETLELEEFFDHNIPKYAILSHRWGEREVDFKRFRKRTALAGPGLRKIERFCQLAASDDLKWAWADTCCIDKKSSAELSEAINSMYRWYKESLRCCVHLSDVTCSPEDITFSKTNEGLSPSLEQQLRKSAWFSRGWTLQELLAPIPQLNCFYDSNWLWIGTLPSLKKVVSDITGISSRYLVSSGFSYGTDFVPSTLAPPMITEAPTFTLHDPTANVRWASVATRMSWVSWRETSRKEDIAYCMMGVFDIHMPLLYGEGRLAAFRRL